MLFSCLIVLRTCWSVCTMADCCSAARTNHFCSTTILGIHMIGRDFTFSSVLDTARLIHWIICLILPNSQYRLRVRRSSCQRKDHANRLLMTLIVKLPLFQDRILHVRLQRLARFSLVKISDIKVFAFLSIHSEFLI